MSSQYIAAIEEADVAIGKFPDGLKAQNLYKSTHFMLITDRGGTGNGDGGTIMAEMQMLWAIIGPKIRNAGLLEIFYNSNKNTSLVIARIFGVKTLPKSRTGYAHTEILK